MTLHQDQRPDCRLGSGCRPSFDSRARRRYALFISTALLIVIVLVCAHAWTDVIDFQRGVRRRGHELFGLRLLQSDRHLLVLDSFPQIQSFGLAELEVSRSSAWESRAPLASAFIVEDLNSESVAGFLRCILRVNGEEQFSFWVTSITDVNLRLSFDRLLYSLNFSEELCEEWIIRYEGFLIDTIESLRAN